MTQLQWGLRLSAVEIIQRRLKVLRRWLMLQWGLRLSAVEILCTLQDCEKSHIASMGPPPFGGGNFWPQVRLMSESLLQWGLRLSAVEISGTYSSVKESPKLQWGLRLSAVEITRQQEEPERIDLLQWGLRLSAVEIREHILKILAADWASMGPPPFGGGNWRGRGRFCGTARGFNGASAFRRWKFYCETPAQPQLIASMGPPPFGGGNLAPIAISGGTCWLQWGLRLSAVEIIIGAGG